MLRGLTLVVLALAALVPCAARADEGDTVYGRLSGDLVLSAGLGGGVALNDRVGPDVTYTTTLELRGRIVDSGGLFVAAEWRPEGDSRVLVGIDLRPVFLARFLLNLQSGDPWVDLFVDSIGLDLGVALGPLDDDVGAATTVGLGVDVPLVLPDGADFGGVFFRIATRWVGALATDQAAPPGGTNDLVVLGVLTVRGIADLGLGAWEPPRYRLRDDED